MNQPGQESRKAAYERQQSNMTANAERLTQRLIDAYNAEPDREYAEAFWGEMLKERGIEVAS